MLFKFVMNTAAVVFAVAALTWFAGAADMTGLASYVVITWWSVGGVFASLSLLAFTLGKTFKRFR